MTTKPTTHKVIKVEKLGTSKAGGRLTLQFRAAPDQIAVERLEGYVENGYTRSMAVGSDNWELISVVCTGPVAFTLENV